MRILTQFLKHKVSILCFVIISILSLNYSLHKFKDDFKPRKVGFKEFDEDLKNLLNILYDLNVFIVDIDFLKDISLNSNLFDKFITKSHFVFAVYENFDFDAFKLKQFCGSKNEIFETHTFYRNKNVIANFYVKCHAFIIQISVFYKYGSFFWIGSESVSTVPPKWFGDVPRAMQEVSINSAAFAGFNIPSDIEKFLFDYENSRFIECNRPLAVYNSKLVNKNYTQNLKKNQIMMKYLNHTVVKIESLFIKYWLAGGTLLGWYRDCGIIPHTKDIDFGLWSTQNIDKIRENFIGDADVPLHIIFGFKNDSYELRLQNKANLQIDLFFVYNYNSSHQWCGYQMYRKKFKRWLPNFNTVCSANLLGIKVLVPCDPMDYLNREYGEMQNWIKPKAVNYTWNNLEKNFTMWSESEWPNAIKFFHRNGILNYNFTLNYINCCLKPKLKKLPSDNSYETIADILDAHSIGNLINRVN